MLVNGLPESQVISIWNTLLESSAALITDAGEPVSLVNPGRLNDGHGADICGAVLVTPHGKRGGDIEFHVLAGDWYRHGHHLDSAYRKVILHVVLRNDRPPILNPVDEIPTISLYRYLSESVRRSLPLREPDITFPVSCHQAAVRDPEKTAAFLESAGEARFQEKAVRYRQFLQHFDAGQVLYAGIMEALGYSKNKVPFAELADRVPLHALEAIVRRKGSRTARLTGLQALLMGTAGLLPSQRRSGTCHLFTSRLKLGLEPSAGAGGSEESRGGDEIAKAPPSLFVNPAARGGLIKENSKPSGVITGAEYVGDDYTLLLEKCWHAVDRPVPMSLQSWDLYKVRPVNSPVRRLAAMSYLLAGCGGSGLFAILRERFECTPSGQGRLLVDGLLVTSDGYWLDHYKFDQPSPVPLSHLIGSDRASEIAVNVLLPFMYAAGSRQADRAMMAKSCELYRSLPAGQGNSIERHLINRLGLHKEYSGTAVRRQGLIHIYKNFCVQGRCGECGLGTLISKVITKTKK